MTQIILLGTTQYIHRLHILTKDIFKLNIFNIIDKIYNNTNINSKHFINDITFV